MPATPTPAPFGDLLSVRQATVVNAICQGKASKQIAQELDMRESTVKVHLHSIMKKLKVQNRRELAVLASRFVSGDSPVGPSTKQPDLEARAPRHLQHAR